MRSYKLSWILVVIAVVSIVLAGCVKAAALPDKPNRHVVDMTGTLQNHDVEELDKRLVKLSEAGKADMYIVLIDSLEDKPIEEYSMELAEKWKPGRKDIDDGLILLVAKKEHKMRLEVGRGLEGTINDAKAGRVNGSMKTFLQKDDYVSAFKVAITETDNIIKVSAEDGNASVLDTPIKHVAFGALKIVALIILLIFVATWCYGAKKISEEHDRNLLLELFNIAALTYAVEKTFEFILNSLDTLLSVVTSGSGSSSSSDGGFDGGGSSDSW